MSLIPAGRLSKRQKSKGRLFTVVRGQWPRDSASKLTQKLF